MVMDGIPCSQIQIFRSMPAGRNAISTLDTAIHAKQKTNSHFLVCSASDSHPPDREATAPTSAEPDTKEPAIATSIPFACTRKVGDIDKTATADPIINMPPIKNRSILESPK